MIGLLTKQRTSAIAIDAGACSFRAVQLRRDDRHWRIHHWVNIETEPDAPDAEPMRYVDALEPAFGAGTFHGREAMLLLGPPDVEYKVLDIPRAVLDQSGEKLKEVLQYELDRHMPWPAAESEVAAWPLRPDAPKDQHTMVVSARTAGVVQHLDIVDRFQLDCSRAEIVPHAMIRLSTARPRDPSDDAAGLLWGMLDIGFRSARLYLCHGDRPVYARVLRGGGREITEKLAEALHIEFRIAEQYKRIYGIEKTDRGVRSVVGGLSRIKEGALPGVLYAILRETLDALVQDIEKSCRFALGQLRGAGAGPIFLIGGGARLRGLADVLTDRLGVPVRIPDADGILNAGTGADDRGQHTALAPDQFAVLAPCVGLALMEEAS